MLSERSYIKCDVAGLKKSHRVVRCRLAKRGRFNRTMALARMPHTAARQGRIRAVEPYENAHDRT